MKRLLITTAVLSLVGAGAAFAQDAKTSPTGIGSPSSTFGGAKTPPNPATSFNQNTAPSNSQAGIKPKPHMHHSKAMNKTMPSGNMTSGTMSNKPS